MQRGGLITLADILTGLTGGTPPLFLFPLHSFFRCSSLAADKKKSFLRKKETQESVRLKKKFFSLFLNHHLLLLADTEKIKLVKKVLLSTNKRRVFFLSFCYLTMIAL